MLSDLISVINQLLAEPHAGLLNGIVFGTKTTLAPWLKNALVTSGTIHVAALSGMNITILVDFVNITLLWLVSRRIASLLTIVLIIGFVWLVGPSPSIIRAAIMGTISLGAVVFGRQYWSLFAFGITLLVMIIISPSWLGELSFQLSAAATLGIILFGPSGKQKCDVGSVIRGNPTSHLSLHYLASHFSPLTSRIWSAIKSELRLTLSAQVFTIPLILYSFHRVSLISPISNVLIAPVVPPLTIFGLLTAFAGWIWLPLGYPFAWVSWLGLQYLIFVVTLTSRIPFASVGW